MAHWADITRNAQTHGDFAGRKPDEQDAYFTFFAGTQRAHGRALFGGLISHIRQSWQPAPKQSLPWAATRLAFPKTSDRK